MTFEYSCSFIGNTSSPPELYRDFKNADYNSICIELSSFNWDALLNSTDLEQCVNAFYLVVNCAIDKWVPWKRRIVSAHPKWFDKKAIQLKNPMRALHKQSKKWNSIKYRNDFVKARSEYKHHIRHSFFNYKMQMQHDINENPQMFYNCVREFRKQSDDLPASMTNDGKSGSTPQEIAELFRDFF